MISAVVIADSINPAGVRLTTFECVVPKWLIAEINTHAMIRRNSASSRAVPTVVLIEKVLADPYKPLEWRYRAPEGGMQAGELMTPEDAAASEQDWLDARDAVLPYVRRLEARRGAKEHINRLMEPWMWSVVVMHATEWDQYFKQRGPGRGAQPEFQTLVAAQMAAFEASTPIARPYFNPRARWASETTAVGVNPMNCWHLPYITDDERRAEGFGRLAYWSAARCAGVSYYRPGDYGTTERQEQRAKDLVKNGHWSPLDMPSCAARGPDYEGSSFIGPLRGWMSFRKFFAGESGSPTHGTQRDAPWVLR